MPHLRLTRRWRPALAPTTFAPATVGLALAATVACATDSATGTHPSPSRGVPDDRRPNDAVLAWNVAAVDALTAHDKYANPMAAARVYALVHVAQHDAVNAADPAFESYVFRGRDAAADPVAAAAAAAHAVLATVFPAQQAALDATLATSLAAVADGEAETRGVALGQQAAAALLTLRASDGSDTPFVGDYTPGTGPGRYQFTPPFDFAAQPGWRAVQPFALTRPDQFRPNPPPALDSKAYARAFAEVKSVGEAGSATRTTDQTAYAKFWYEFSELGWNRIARTVAADRQLGLRSTARLFALLNMAMSDSYVAGWDAKFHYDFWRPVTAIRAADTDGNAATAPDAAWEPLMVTPPVQDYPSTHSALGNAAAEVLASVLGDRTRFTFTSPSAEPANSARTFARFSQAADENADSRVRAGIHFRFATDAGQELGRRVGRWTVSHHLRP
jgi:hypothetical protein